MKPDESETLDSIKNIKLLQSKTGYRFSVDALLLENFISKERPESGVELGTGSGIISILLAKRVSNIKITAVEIQKSLAERAKKNAEINGLHDRIKILNMDIKRLREGFPPNGFDIVFTNPPFRKTQSGRLSKDLERATARHEIKINLQELIDTASYLLRNTGSLYIIYHPFRLVELIRMLLKRHLEPKRMRFVHSGIGEDAKMVLVEAVKDSGTWLKIDPPLYIYEESGEYTVEMERIYGV
jgi:tRNA1Val (adenine37-N6)-methyltransferase